MEDLSFVRRDLCSTAVRQHHPQTQHVLRSVAVPRQGGCLLNIYTELHGTALIIKQYCDVKAALCCVLTNCLRGLNCIALIVNSHLLLVLTYFKFSQIVRAYN